MSIVISLYYLIIEKTDIKKVLLGNSTFNVCVCSHFARDIKFIIIF